MSPFIFFFFNNTATTEIYTLSLHDALPISQSKALMASTTLGRAASFSSGDTASSRRSEEHTSELQSRGHLVCRLLLEKKKKILSNSIKTTFILRNHHIFRSI